MIVTAPHRDDHPNVRGPFEWNPCDHVFDVESGENRLAWFFAQTKVPAELVALSSGSSQNCGIGWSADSDERALEFSVFFVFFYGEGEAREEAVWWLLYQPWEDPYRHGARLRGLSGGDVEYFDGYVVAFSSSASDEIRLAAMSEPVTEIWPVMYEQHQRALSVP
jgi:hypothetical protein